MNSLVFIFCILAVGVEFVSAGSFRRTYWNLSALKDLIVYNKDLDNGQALVPDVFWRLYSNSRMPEMLPFGQSRSVLPDVPPHKVLAIITWSLSGSEYLEVYSSFSNGKEVADKRKPNFVWTEPTLKEAEEANNEFDSKVEEAIKKFQGNHKDKFTGVQNVYGHYELKKIGDSRKNSASYKLYAVVFFILN